MYVMYENENIWIYGYEYIYKVIYIYIYINNIKTLTFLVDMLLTWFVVVVYFIINFYIIRKTYRLK